MRSLLFVPGDSEKKLAKGFASATDVIIVDLEDSVSLANKEAARAIAAAFITAERHTTRAQIFVRVNDLSTGLTDKDLAALVSVRPDGIMLPKSNSGKDVQRLAAMLRVHEAEAGLGDGDTRILPLITETPAGVFTGGTYANCSPRLAGLTWGAEDLSAALGARTARDATGRYTDAFRLARAVTLLAAAAADIPAVDTVFPNFRDMAGFEAECTEAERDGFTAKMAIHPDQVPIINAAFTPSAEALERARAIVQAFADAGNPGVVAVEGKMYDRPHLRLAERLIARASSVAG
ncbi:MULTISPECIES: HpcH/HpaI aldolase/citrate lyase family protein [Mesorhizobium]|uniref:CoA ester lyase n=1 Tax=Mesorhizobium denitrificans TaxID=2294114 RepID=A0A371XBQ2_9HYPH|nr:MULTISPECIES: CoA ester lyase [Mesorhizobium]RFC66667.1 CoA ester lyase [Mesorhizobium denitrificans]